MIYKYGIIGI